MSQCLCSSSWRKGGRTMMSARQWVQDRVTNAIPAGLLVSTTIFLSSDLDIFELSISLTRLRGSWVLERTCPSCFHIQVTGTIGTEFGMPGMNWGQIQLSDFRITKSRRPGSPAVNRQTIAMAAPRLPLINSDYWRARWSLNSLTGKARKWVQWMQ